MPFKALVAHAMGRWMMERDNHELKSKLGLSHYESRNGRGFHHHVSLCIAAYGVLMLKYFRGKKTPLDSTNLPYPKVSSRAAAGPMQRHVPGSIATPCPVLARVIARALPQCPCCGAR
jgi:hypothetical protein